MNGTVIRSEKKGTAAQILRYDAVLGEVIGRDSYSRVRYVQRGGTTLFVPDVTDPQDAGTVEELLATADRAAC
ncbi:MAG TPA: hypothetical protein VKX49_03375 [Bryobacteraceae bacterium]|nr:hypothetical protein [Bryobacteraceae bacterium]